MDQNQQREIFEKIYNEYSKKVFRLCMGYTNDENLSNDLTQDCFIKIWQHLGEFRNESSYSTWIYRIAANTCLTFLRKDKTKESSLTQYNPMEDLSGEKHQLEEQISLLYKCIHQLNPADRMIITMVLEEVSHKEIGETLGLTENNVSVKVHRIKKDLMNLYKQYERV